MADKISFEILADGTIKTENDKISAANHRAADNLNKDLERDLGGKVDIKKKNPNTVAKQTQNQGN